MQKELRYYIIHHKQELDLFGNPASWIIEKLAQGEYNINYILKTEDQSFVLRLNTGSQMDLDNQIEYEYLTLKAMEACGRTPRALYLDKTKRELPYGFLVMDYLRGRSLDYRRDLELVASCLADIHAFPSDVSHLICPGEPKKEMLLECEKLFSKYRASKSYSEKKGEIIRRMLDYVKDEVREDEAIYRTCINTELNSGNFIVDEDFCYLVDWEKPIKGDVAQDLGHFLAPTTTLWKTDVILSPREVEAFLDNYVTRVAHRFDTHGLKDRTKHYIKLNCMRGLTWCAMASVEYLEEDRAIKNEDTQRKLEYYLQEDFLDRIEKEYIL